MNFHIMTLFPELIDTGMNTSIIGRALRAGLIGFESVNIRNFSDEPHGKVDDYPYGGGAGMIMQAKPIYDCWKDIVERILKGAGADTKIRTLYMSPAGRPFNQELAAALAKEEDLVILCGRYEGVDQRALDLIGAEEISIGDYVLTGGELPALVVADAVSRMVPGVLSNSDSGIQESFSKFSPSSEFTKRQRAEAYGSFSDSTEVRLLEYPQYTRPEEFLGMKVPKVLLSGNHAEIEVWRRRCSVEKTLSVRPDII